MEKCNLCGKQIDLAKEISTKLIFNTKQKGFVYCSECFKELPKLMAKARKEK